IRCWTMGPDIFKRFPELYSDMPAFNHIPQTPSSAEAKLFAQMQQRKLLPPPPSPQVVQTGSVTQGEEEEEIKPPPAGSQYIPIEKLHTHIVATPKPPQRLRQGSRPQQQQQLHNFQQRSHSQPQSPPPNPHM